MEHLLSFEKLVNYDAGVSGITLDTTLKLSSKSVAFPAKIDTVRLFAFSREAMAKNSAWKSRRDFFSASARRWELL